MQASTTETQPKRYQCRHIHTQGHRCGSPALRGELFCYYHHTTRKPAPKLARPCSIVPSKGTPSSTSTLPEDRSDRPRTPIGPCRSAPAESPPSEIDPQTRQASSSTASRSPAPTCRGSKTAPPRPWK